MAVWTINGDGDDNSPDSVEADGVNGNPPSLNTGESGTFELWFTDRGPSDDLVQRFEDARAFAVNADQYDTYEQIDSGLWFWREQIAGGPSPLVEIIPPSSLLTSRRIWGLIEGSEAVTDVPQARCVLSISIFKLANHGTGTGEFDSESAIRQAREVHGP